jgi:hypothetical protein
MNFIEVIVTDWDIVLMNVVDKVFPKFLDILCRFHISMNFKANQRRYKGNRKRMRCGKITWRIGRV